MEAGEASVDAGVGLVHLLQHLPHNPVHVGARAVVELLAQLRCVGLDAERGGVGALLQNRLYWTPHYRRFLWNRLCCNYHRRFLIRTVCDI